MLATARNRPAITGTPCVILVAPLAAWAGGRGQLWIRIHINGFANVLGDPWSVLAGGRLWRYNLPLARWKSTICLIHLSG